jgi:hypothetical protein
VPARHVEPTAEVIPEHNGVQRSQTIDSAHGRIGTRRVAICHNVGGLFSDRRYSGEFRFPRPWPPAAWWRARPNETSRSSGRCATVSDQPDSMATASLASSAGTGGSRTAARGRLEPGLPRQRHRRDRFRCTSDCPGGSCFMRLAGWPAYLPVLSQRPNSLRWLFLYRQCRRQYHDQARYV